LGMNAFARGAPDKAALVLGAEIRTYADLAERAARLATVFHDRGVPSDGTGAVAVMVPNSFEFFETAFGACRVEARFLPVNWHLKSDELAWILADSGAQVLVAHPSLNEYVDVALEQTPTCSVLWTGEEYERAIASASRWSAEGWRSPAFIFCRTLPLMRLISSLSASSSMAVKQRFVMRTELLEFCPLTV